MDRRPIGVMDSGIGGLSVVRVMREHLPNESIVFVGDQGHFPYGLRTQADVCHLALNIGKYLLTHDIKLMVIACNTATAASLPTLQKELPIPVIGVIKPGAEAALAQPHHDRIGVIATESTTKAGAYPATIHALDPDVEVISKAAQPMVAVVQHNEVGTPKAQKVVDEQLAIFKEKPVQALILGCTHFPFLSKEITNFLGEQVVLVDPALETVRTAKKLLADQDLLTDSKDKGSLTLYSTADNEELIKGANKWLAGDQFTCNHVDIPGD
ncbi:glutamate racemase [uncultured Limosilactobacillus sp.]|uniref:glutamate racemase n=1 Tax=uncultured Limosilactobacillus sp. TaxID=2837629 RepID=UPI0025FA65A3|nr:glutamate racemase [uncultured Limosilactobacillus sp.]